MTSVKRLRQKFIKTNLTSIEFNLLKDFVDRGLNGEALKQIDEDIKKLERAKTALDYFKRAFNQFGAMVEEDCED